MTLLELWWEYADLIDADLHEVYGIDTADQALMASRSWPWFRSRMLGLASTPSRLQRVLAERR